MNGRTQTRALRRQQLSTALLCIGCLALAAALLVLNQPAGAALLPLVAGLLIMLQQRSARVRALARQLGAGKPLAKLEVPYGEWGELCRAINGLMRDRQIEQRLRSVASAPLPDDAVLALLSGGLQASDEPRFVAVLLVNWNGARRLGARTQGAALHAWQSLAAAVQRQAQQHGALLQPCGDALMLVFGAFREHSAEATVRAALSAADALQASWHDGRLDAAGALALSLACGPAMVTLLPGLGCSVLGTPVEQAMQIAHHAVLAPQHRLLCGESAYYVLRRAGNLGWQPTTLRTQHGQSEPQVVYSLR